MLSKQTQLAQLHSLTGRLFHENDWTYTELAELLSQSQPSSSLSTPILPIPLASSLDQRDPRLDHKEYQRLFFAAADKDSNPLGFERKRLNLIVGFEGTLISLATESDSIRVSNVTSNPQILANSSRIVTESLQGQTLIIAVRPGADEFLQKIMTVASLYLVSRMSHSVVKAVLKALQWEGLFEDIYSQAETKGISTCFPRLVDDEAKRLTLAFDDQLWLWQGNDLRYVIPSKRYWPLDRFILKATTLVYHIDTDTTHRETLSSDSYSPYEVEPGSNQLEIVTSRMLTTACDLYSGRYRAEARTVFFTCKNPYERLFVSISDLNRKLEAIALIRASGKQRVEVISQADTLVAVDSPNHSSRLILLEKALIQGFFCVEPR